MKSLHPATHSADDIDVLISTFRLQNKEIIRDFLEEFKLTTIDNKENMLDEVRSALEDGRISDVDIARYLDEIGSWGKQHYFLYDLPSAYIKQWFSPTWVKKHLERQKHQYLYDNYLPIVLPVTLTISSVHQTPSTVKITAIHKCRRERRLSIMDKEEGNFVYKAHEVYYRRCIVFLELHRESKFALLSIQQLNRKADYDRYYEYVVDIFEQLINIDGFERITLNKAIKNLGGRPDLATRRLKLATHHGGGLGMRSPRGERDYKRDSVLKKVRATAGDRVIGEFAVVYWLSKPPNPIRTQLRTHIYGDDGRIGFMDRASEAEVRYVIGCIRDLN